MIKNAKLMSSSIQLIEKPSEFYKQLQSLILSAKFRIIISALYLGEGELALQLLDCIEKALSASDVQVDLIIDHSRFHRGSQQKVHSRLCTLLSKYPLQLGVSLYEMPLLRKFPFSLLPPWLKEIASVYHCKFILSDDKVLLTGANLSDDYFTIRQDRYWLFTCPKQPQPTLVDYLHRFSDAIISSSWQLSADGTLFPSRSGSTPLSTFLSSNSNHPTHELGDGLTAQPVIQHNTLGANVEENALLDSIHNSVNHDSTVCSPYTNFTSEFQKTLLQHFKSNKSSLMRIISPAETAHGFYGGRGFKAHLPALHESLLQPLLAKLISDNNKSAGSTPRFSWFQFVGYENVTQLHSKGIWSFSNDQHGKCWSYIGSSNLSMRSWRRDFEFGLVVSSSNGENDGGKKFKNLLKQELEGRLIPACKLNHKAPKHKLWIHGLARYVIRPWL